MWTIGDQYAVCIHSEEGQATSNRPSVNQKKSILSEEELFFYFIALPSFDPGFEHRFCCCILNLSRYYAVLLSPAVTVSQPCSLIFLQNFSFGYSTPLHKVLSNGNAALLLGTLTSVSQRLHLTRIILFLFFFFFTYPELCSHMDCMRHCDLGLKGKQQTRWKWEP